MFIIYSNIVSKIIQITLYYYIVMFNVYINKNINICAYTVVLY